MTEIKIVIIINLEIFEELPLVVWFIKVIDLKLKIINFLIKLFIRQIYINPVIKVQFLFKLIKFIDL